MSKKEIKDPFNKLNEIEQPNTPVQTVVPVSSAKKRKRDNEQSYTLYLNKDILKQLKNLIILPLKDYCISFQIN